LIDVFSPCVTYNKLNTYQWFRPRVYKLEGEVGYDQRDIRGAMTKSFEWGDRIPLGLFYKDEQPTYEDSDPALRNGPLVHREMGMDEALFHSLVEELM
jgi:2-oxoglutarate ferredoxin oxidoreductase subunit beta